MLSEIEITYFSSRIDDVLEERRVSEWQRNFLLDMRMKIKRHGTRTRFSEKQFATLKTLTSIKGNADLRLVYSGKMPSPPRQPRRWGLSYLEQKFLTLAVVLIVIAISSFSRQVLDTYGLTSLSMEKNASSSSRNFSVTDGDTIKMDDGTRIRLVGFKRVRCWESTNCRSHWLPCALFNGLDFSVTSRGTRCALKAMVLALARASR